MPVRNALQRGFERESQIVEERVEDRNDELKEIHARLDEHRAEGEWFALTPFIARHNINKLRSIL